MMVISNPPNVSDTTREPRSDWLHEWGYDPLAAPPRAAYVHIPFCRQRCGYCNFSLLANREDLFDRFLSALQRELSALQHARPVETIFLGGGTPTILGPAHLERLGRDLSEWLPLKPGGEWSIEANPLDVTDAICEQLVALGVNRISLGGQSFQAPKLATLERDHSGDALRSAIQRAQRFFPHVSLDLIFAAPHETLDDWRRDLTTACELQIEHISTYGLTYEKGARFWRLRETGELRPANEELELAMYELAIDQLTAHGYEHYEISNFAKPGAYCRRNQTYWDGDPWWAFGASAARFLGQTRSVNHRGTLIYLRRIESNQNPMDEVDHLSQDAITRERFVFGMRQRRGVDWQVIRSIPSLSTSTLDDIESTIQRHVDAGWMERDGSRVRLTRRGLVLSDGLWNEYL